MITVYVIQGKSKRYIGITNNLKRRLAEHRTGKTTGSRITGDFSLLHTEEFPDHISARNREKFLKSGKGRNFLNTLRFGTRSA
jgi:putative endonuclease